MPKAPSTKKNYTLEDLKRLPEGTRAELLNGRMYEIAEPNRRHQELMAAFFKAVWECVRNQRGFCKPFMAPFSVFLNGDSQNYVEPDISVICNPWKLTDQGCIGAPDWIVEIASLESRDLDHGRKRVKYQKAGVREYWVVDEESGQVRVYNFREGTVSDYDRSDEIPVGICPGSSIRVPEEEQ